MFEGNDTKSIFARAGLVLCIVTPYLIIRALLPCAEKWNDWINLWVVALFMYVILGFAVFGVSQLIHWIIKGKPW